MIERIDAERKEAWKAVVMVCGLVGFGVLLYAVKDNSPHNTKIDQLCKREPARFEKILRSLINIGTVRSVRGSSDIVMVVDEPRWAWTSHDDKVAMLLAGYCIGGGGRTSATAIGYHDGKSKGWIYDGNYFDD